MAKPRRKDRPQPIASALGALSAQARDQTALATLLREALQPDLRAGFAGSDLDASGVLTIFAAAPEWAARLRFETAELETAAVSGGWQVRQVVIKLVS